MKAPHHHGPSGLHMMPRRINEMRHRGVPEDAIRSIVEEINNKLPKSFVKGLSVGPNEDTAQVLGKSADAANSAALDLLSQADGAVLISGEVPPHLICSLLDTGISAIQVHDPSPHKHDHRPPHFRDMEGWYPDQFTGVLALTDIVGDTVKVVLLHAFMSGGDSAFVCPLALMATRLWPEAKVVAVMSDHRAPHHLVELRREVDQFLFWD